MSRWRPVWTRRTSSQCASALDPIRAAVAASLDRGVVLADAAYGINTEFRDGLTGLDLHLHYVVGVQSSMTAWGPGKQPLPAKPRGKRGRPPRLLQRSTKHQPVSVQQLAMSLARLLLRQLPHGPYCGSSSG